MTKIEQWAEAIKKHEGYIPAGQYPKDKRGSPSFRNKNPGNFRCYQLVMGEFGAIGCENNLAIFPTYEKGWQALVTFLTYACTNQLRDYKGTMSLYEFYAKYAPTSDGNYPKGYAEAVAKDMGISPYTQIKTFIEEKPMAYWRFAHMDSVLVKEGDTVKKGQKLGTIGTGNGQFSAHLHLDRPTQKLTPWTAYVYGMSKEQVKAFYADPTPLDKQILPNLSHYGYRYLDPIQSGAKRGFHPGSDLNGPGAGNADLGQPFYSPCDGKVVYCYSGSGSNGGWGKLMVIEEATGEPQCTKCCQKHC